MNTFFSNEKAPPRVLVIGDVVLDRNIHGHTDRIANEAPVPVHNIDKTTYHLGGAGNVAANLRALGADVSILCPLGILDDTSIEIRKLYDIHEIHYIGLCSDIYTPIMKTRGFCGKKMMYRFDSGSGIISESTMGLVFESFEEYMSTNTIDVIVCSDYGYGVLCDSFAKFVVEYAARRGIPTVVDPRGDFSKYRGCTYLKPNWSQAVKASGKEGIDEICSELYRTVCPRYTCITMADEGMIIRENESGVLCKAVAQPIEVIDVTGAGDIVCSVLAYMVGIGEHVSVCVKVAVFLATESVKHCGTYVLQSGDIWALHRHLHPSKIIKDSSILKHIPRHGERVVFTNGCFDMFHRGHLESLKFAKAQGTILIVGINSDESIRRIKGEKRPIIGLEDRIAMLESNTYVDYVISFSEDTSIHLQELIRPDVYVKGGEYEGHVFPGAGAGYIGEICLGPMWSGSSTSGQIARIMERYS